MRAKDNRGGGAAAREEYFKEECGGLPFYSIVVERKRIQVVATKQRRSTFQETLELIDNVEAYLTEHAIMKRLFWSRQDGFFRGAVAASEAYTHDKPLQKNAFIIQNKIKINKKKRNKNIF